MAVNHRLGSYLRLIRLPNSFTAVSNILAAQLLAAQGLPEWGPLLLLIAASVCLYSAGMALNDCFDYREDCRERPERPLPAGEIALGRAWLLGAGLLIAGMAFALAVSLAAFGLALAIALLILLYDGWAKHTLLGPPVMGLCRYGNWLLGLSYGYPLSLAWLLALPIFFYITALTLLARAETTAEHRAPVLYCAAGILVAAAAMVLLYPLDILHRDWTLIVVAVALVALLAKLAGTYRRLTPQRVQATVKMLVLGVIPFDALLVLAGGPLWGAAVVVLLLVPSSLLARKMYVT